MQGAIQWPLVVYAMRVLNFKSKRFAVGKNVRVIKTYQSGNVTLNIGDVGKITGESYHNLPDMNLFNIRVVDLDFGIYKISIGEAIAETFMETL